MLEPKTSTGRDAGLLSGVQPSKGLDPRGDISRFCGRLDDIRARLRSIIGATNNHANRIIHGCDEDACAPGDAPTAPTTLDGIDMQLDFLNQELEDMEQAALRFSRL